jgi:hypothetical protein
MDTKCLVCGIPNFERIQKDGTFSKYLKYKEKKINEYTCLFKNDSLFIIDEYRTNYKNNNILITKLNIKSNDTQKIIKKTSNKLTKLKYYKSIYKNNIYIYQPKNLNKIAKYNYLMENEYNFKSKQLIKKLAVVFKIYKLRFPKLSNKDLFIQIFYAFYIISLLDEIHKKYKINLINDFDNYHEVYKFLKEKKYVKKYNEKIIPQIKNKVKSINDLLKKECEKIKNIKDKIEKNQELF